MIVLNHADLILDETYLVSTETRGYVREPEESPFQPIPSSPPQPPEDTDLLPFLPDLIPVDHLDIDLECSGPNQLVGPSKPHPGREKITVEMGHEGLMIRDLVHPALIDPLRNHQNSTFKLIKLSIMISPTLPPVNLSLQSVTSTTSCPRSTNSTLQTWPTWWSHSGRKPPRCRVPDPGVSTPSLTPGSSGWLM